MTNDDRLFLNGIDGETGQYLVEPMELEQVAAMAKGDMPAAIDQYDRWIKAMADN